MKVFILCGGTGTRLDNLGKVIAKPMVRIGNEPMLYHIIRNFVLQGYNEFVLCTGHKSETINRYFTNKNEKHIFDLNKITKNRVNFKFKKKNIQFFCDIVYTGHATATGGRIKKAYRNLNLKEDIIMTYGDGLSNVNINKLVRFHYKKNSEITITAVRPKHKYGILKIKNNKIFSFDDSKSERVNSYINGGFFVISKKSIKYIKKNSQYWENEPLKTAIKKKKVFAYKHNKFWQSVDTLKDLKELNKMYYKNKHTWEIDE